MSFYNRFQTLCISQGKSPTGVALELGVSRSTVNYWKSGNTPKHNTLSSIADYFSVPDRFLSGHAPFDAWELIESNRKGFFSYVDISADKLRVIWGIDKNNPDTSDVKDLIRFISDCIKSLNADEEGNWIIKLNENYQYLLNDSMQDFSNIENIIPMPKMKKVPLLGSIACGEPILADGNIESYINMPEDINGTFALKCKGDSMINARIFDGDIVYIRQQPDVENGEIAAVLINDEATLKKVYKYPNRIELRAENPTIQPFEYEGEEMNTVKILGKAVYFISRVM